MKLYDGGRAPNPRRVRIFLAEKGITVEMQAVDLGKLEHKAPAFTAVNPLQRLPALELDDGTIITESLAICRYFEALHPQPNLFGTTALEIATVDMWNRRLELHLYAPVQYVFRHSHPGMKDFEIPQIADWAEVNKPRVTDFLAILDKQLANHAFVAGERFTVADITGLVSVDLMKPARLTVSEEFGNVRRWYADMNQRPSARA